MRQRLMLWQRLGCRACPVGVLPFRGRDLWASGGDTTCRGWACSWRRGGDVTSRDGGLDRRTSGSGRRIYKFSLDLKLRLRLRLRLGLRLLCLLRSPHLFMPLLLHSNGSPKLRWIGRATSRGCLRSLWAFEVSGTSGTRP